MAFDCFIQIKDIPGESTDSKHANWIEVLSYSVGVRQAGEATSAVGGLSSGRANFSDLTFVKLLDASSSMLAKACAEGRHIGQVILECCQATGQKHCFQKYTLTDTMIGSVSPAGNTRGVESKPLEEVSVKFTKIQFDYTPIDQKGNPGTTKTTWWDLKNNTGG